MALGPTRNGSCLRTVLQPEQLCSRHPAKKSLRQLGFRARVGLACLFASLNLRINSALELDAAVAMTIRSRVVMAVVVVGVVAWLSVRSTFLAG